MTDLDALRRLPGAESALADVLAALPDAAWSEPSALPGWTRGHVVAHLVLNAEGMAAAVTAVREGRPATLYASQEARDGDIEGTATADPTVLRDRLRTATTVLAAALASLPDQPPEVDTAFVPRVPGSDRGFVIGELPWMREREVRIHLVDLDVGHGHRAWPATFSEQLVTSLAVRVDATLSASDADRTWHDAQDTATVVTGSLADLAWWLTGRGAGGGLSADGGPLPHVAPW